jgi:4-hydroxy-tetrahydrodipicolinate reductase
VIRVGVVGAGGRMGREVARAVGADPGLEFVAAIDPGAVGEAVEGVRVTGDLAALLEAGTEVAVDFTAPNAVMETIRWTVANRIHTVVGTTGITPEDLDELARLTDGASANVIVAPNFAIGAVLMMRFAELASQFMPSAEVIELHHDGKVDAPSGTALATARAMAAARGRVSGAPRNPGSNSGAEAGQDAYPGARGADVDGIHVHSVRLPGLVAHQEVVLGGPGQTLSIRHDSTDRTSFMPGVLMAVKAVASRPGLTVGLGSVLDDA